MNIKKVLKKYLDYYNSTTGVGHTITLLKSIKALKNSEKFKKPILVFYNQAQAKHHTKNFLDKGDVLISTLFSDDDLRGLKLPLLFDNTALDMIFEFSFKKINELEEENKGLRCAISKLRKETPIYLSR